MCSQTVLQCSQSMSPIISRTVATRLGPYMVKACSSGVHGLGLHGVTDENFDPQGPITEQNSTDITGKGSDHPLDVAIAWLQAYFEDEEVAKKLKLPPLCLPEKESTEFERQVWNTLAEQVTFGETVTYGELGEKAVNNAKASRAVGTAMKKNPIALIIPCHRVIRKGGELGNYAGGTSNLVKKWLLEYEGLSP